MNMRSLSGVLVVALAATLSIVTAQTSKPASSPVQAARTPAEVVANFFEAVAAGRVDDAIALMTPLPDLPPEVLEELREDFAKPLRTKPYVVGHLQIGTSAVVIVHDSSPNKHIIDLDPAYLIRRGSTWYLLPQVDEFESRWFPLDASTTKSLEELEGWFRAQTPDIARMLASE